MKSKRSIFALILALVMIGSLFAACGTPQSAPDAPAAPSGSDDDAPGAAGEDLEYYELMFLRDYDTSDDENNAHLNLFRNYLLENFNIGIKEIHFAGDMQERLMIMLAGGDYPDLINPRTTPILKAYAEAGALLNMGELFEQYAPNVLERHASRVPFWKSMSGMDDDQIWAMTYWQPDEIGAQAGPMLEWLIRSDILEQQGFPEIVDENDLYEVLRRGLEENPTTNGQPTVAFSHPLSAWGTDGLRCITYTYNMGRLNHLTANRGMVFSFEDNLFIDVVSDPSYRAGLEFFNRLWRDGLYDRDAVTDDWDQFEAKMKEGRILAAYFFVWPWDYDFNPELVTADAPFRYVPMPMQLSIQRERGEVKGYPVNSGEVWSSIAITKNAKFPERIAQAMNWQASDEGMLLLGWGREGVEYTVENGRRVATEEFFDRMENDYDTYRYVLYGPSDFGFYLGVDSNGQSLRISHDADVVARRLDPIVKNVWAQYGWANSYDMYHNNKNFTMATDRQVDLKTAVPTLSDAQNRNWERIDSDTHDATMQLVTASSPEAFNQAFENLLARRAELGHGELIELWNREYKEMREFYGFD